MAHNFDLNNKVDLLIVPADNGDVNTSYVQPFADSTGANGAVFMLVVGAAGGNVDFKLTQATTSGGAGAKDITGAAITALTTSTDECIVTIEIGPGALDDAGGFTYVRGEVTVAGSNTAIYGLVYIRHWLRYPGVGTQPTAYRQQVKVLN